MVAITAQNGALPASALVSIGGGKVLRADAAASYLRCLAEGMPTGVTSAYRTKAEQKALLDLYGYPHAEYPGRSQHGEGVALDLPEPARTWMVQYGATHGWRRTVMPAEPWHFEYVPALDHHRSSPPTQEDDMPTIDEIGERMKEILRAPEFQAYFQQPTSVAVGGATMGPAPTSRFAADTRADVMRILDIVRGISAQIAALGTAAPAQDVDAIAAAIADSLDDSLAARVADLLSKRLAA